MWLSPMAGLQPPLSVDSIELTGDQTTQEQVSSTLALLKCKAPTATVPELLSFLNETGISVTDSRNGLVNPRRDVNLALDAVPPEVSYSSFTHG